jgi:hypothetical protein
LGNGTKETKGQGKSTDNTRLTESMNDSVLFGDSICYNDLIFQSAGDDLHVGIKEEGKDFNDLSDRLVIKNWHYEENRIESFEFEDGSSWNHEEVLLAIDTFKHEDESQLSGEPVQIDGVELGVPNNETGQLDTETVPPTSPEESLSSGTDFETTISDADVNKVVQDMIVFDTGTGTDAPAGPVNTEDQQVVVVPVGEEALLSA